MTRGKTHCTTKEENEREEWSKGNTRKEEEREGERMGARREKVKVKTNEP